MSWVPEDRRFLRSCGVDASTPIPGGKDWTHERVFERVFPNYGGTAVAVITLGGVSRPG